MASILETGKYSEHYSLSGYFKVFFIRCSVENCMHEGDGAGIYIEGAELVGVENSFFSGCVSNGKHFGGCCFLSGVDTYITRSYNEKAFSYGSSCYFQYATNSSRLNDTSLKESKTKDYHGASSLRLGYAYSTRCNGSRLESNYRECTIHAWNGPPNEFSFLTFWWCVGEGVYSVHSIQPELCTTRNICVLNCSESQSLCLVTGGNHEIEDCIFESKIPPFGRWLGFSGVAVARRCFFGLAPSVSYVSTQDCVIIESLNDVRIVTSMCYLRHKTNPFTICLERPLIYQMIHFILL